MVKKVKLLDCTLRDGAYINSSKFGVPALKGIIKKMQDADIDIIECGWLKDAPHEEGSSYYHVPSDMEQYLLDYSERYTYVAMIDWDRYDTTALPECNHKSINAVRVVFPRGKAKEGMEIGRKIRDKGYLVYLQAANTLGYSDEELEELAQYANDFKPVALSVVDTFGAMYFDDLKHIVSFLDKRLDPEIQLGFHSHNNKQLSFALTMSFVELLENSERGVIVDASLSGMGRGAGNATTELVANYLNEKQHGNYDMNAILDAIDMYIDGIREKYSWGYSTPYFIAGMYQCHVNNIAYLRKNHRTNARDMRNVISSLGVEERRHYDYDLLEQRYMENQDRQIDDDEVKQQLQKIFRGRKVLLVAPGKSINACEAKVKEFIDNEKPVVIGVNAINTKYSYDYLFFVNHIRYDYAREAYGEVFGKTKKILLSNIHTKAKENEFILNFNRAIKRGWEHFDNAVICALRLLGRLGVDNVALAGFDGFKTMYNESYSDPSLPTLNPDNKWDELNEEIKDMFRDVKLSVGSKMKIEFVTESIFDV
ncbi:hypothetical protein [Anaerovibrio lipolyticus]|jgi:4-hydroxy 2-oxovalerate aldolase|uniref:hypothetical protein n=1 Tax=Anaerovibrio lipolyticus TaxID=82374 RepID=UPI0026F179AA|nr:hypothetical protein [Anaerovibrio lipolyticus]MBE6105113.1 hypothetical protein [Anaerovibrio lipolyticus]